MTVNERDVSQDRRHRLYAEWREFYESRITGWLTLDELRADVARLQDAGNAPCAETLLIHAMHILDERHGTCTCPSGDGSLRWPCPAQPAPLGQVERGVGRPVPERAALMRRLTNAQREVRSWPEWITARAAMPKWIMEWDD